MKTTATTPRLAPVCRVEDIPVGLGRAFHVAGHKLAVFLSRTGAVFAVANACPHRGGPLADGILSDRCVTCPLHERRFELGTGAALSSGEGVTAHRIEVRGDLVLVELAAAALECAA